MMPTECLYTHVHGDSKKLSQNYLHHNRNKCEVILVILSLAYYQEWYADRSAETFSTTTKLCRHLTLCTFEITGSQQKQNYFCDNFVICMTILVSAARVVLWLDHSDAMCSRAW